MESVPPKTDSSTPSQQRAIAARGNVLVMAGAGTGKTKTLVARCLDCLERDGAAIDELLIVTFTEAAAAEMRDRLRRAIEAKTPAPTSIQHPASSHFWHEQLARFDLAHIGTLHGFCLKLIREHFHELGLDPQLAILDEGEARQLAGETLDELFQSHYEGEDAFSLAVQDLIQIYGGGRDEKIRALILRLHHYSQTRPDAAGWLAGQTAKFTAAESADWQNWLLEAIQNWRDEWLPVLENLKTSNAKAAELAGILQPLGSARVPRAKSGVAPDLSSDKNVRRDAGHGTPEACAPHFTRADTAEVLEQILAADADWPRGTKTKFRPALEDLFDDAAFLAALAPVKNGVDPLAEDWSWIRGPMETLLRLAAEFADKFAGAKREQGTLDFHDLEQFALKLLWDFTANRPTSVAESRRAKLKFIFVDEYQDINAAQNQIIAALSRDVACADRSAFLNDDATRRVPESGVQPPQSKANRFLVGDVKQSIYRFRLADPQIFRDYAQRWRGETGQTIPLTDNFRSREGLLNLVNSVFRVVMREAIGGVAYDADAELKFGAPDKRAALSAANDSAPRAELLLRLKTSRSEAPADNADGENGGLADLDETQKEARLVAQHLKRLHASRHEIFDEKKNEFRPVEWRDMTVLLRSPSGRSEIYAQEFERAGIPLEVARGGFYESSEILDLLSLLRLLDNPLQDVPCLAVLRSPLVGLSLAELAEIRLAARDARFWTAVNRVQSPKSEVQSPLAEKISRFLERFSRWRKLARQVSLSGCLEAVLAETHYAEWLRSRPRGAQRAANVAGFVRLAQQFDQFQRQGLFRFLRFIEAQQAAGAEPEVPAEASGDAVRLMSIHQSKGLEFPVVVVADLAKAFNEQDLRAEIILDEKFGLCPKVKPPHTGRRYPSLPHWLAQRHQRRELRGEELRLLYVAMTRARDTLVLTASVTEKKWETVWKTAGLSTARQIAGAKSFADWLGLWFSNQVQSPKSKVQSSTAGEFENLRWRLVEDAELCDGAGTLRGDDRLAPRAVPANLEPLDEATAAKLRALLAWHYPFAAATELRAKASVTALRREAEELDDATEPFFPAKLKTQKQKTEGRNRKLSAAEIGAAHHKFLQHVALEQTGGLAAEARRLTRENLLSADESAALDLAALAAFWNCDLGAKIRAQPAGCVKRELPFTARFSPAELAEITGRPAADGLHDEFVVVQGVADLAVLRPREIWLVDFKTDDVGQSELPEKIKIYRPQLKLYAAALEKIFSRPVTDCRLFFLAARRAVAVD